MEPVETVLKNIYQSNTYRKDLGWPHFDDQPRVLREAAKILLRHVVLDTLGMPDSTENNGICFKETLILIFMQKLEFMSYLFLPKILQLCYFGYFRHSWLPTPKQQCLPVGNCDAYYTSFLRYYTLANSQYDWP